MSIKTAKNYGKHIIIMGDSSTTSEEMKREADLYVDFGRLKKENLDEFRKRVYDEVRDIHVTRFPYNNFLYPEHLDQY